MIESNHTNKRYPHRQTDRQTGRQTDRQKGLTNILVEPWPESRGCGVVPFDEHRHIAIAGRLFTNHMFAGAHAVFWRCHLFWNSETGIAGAMLDVIGENFRQMAEGGKVFFRDIPTTRICIFRESDASLARTRDWNLLCEALFCLLRRRL